MNKLYDGWCGYIFFAFGVVLLVTTLSACKSKATGTLEADQPERPNLLTIPTLNPVSMPTPQISAKGVHLPILPATGRDFDNGKLLYEAHCATCHGINGEGQLPDPLGPNMGRDNGRNGKPGYAIFPIRFLHLLEWAPSEMACPDWDSAILKDTGKFW